MHIQDRFVEDRVFERLTDSFLVELVNKDQQAHTFHLANVFIQILIEKRLIHRMRVIGIPDLCRIQVVKGQFRKQFHVVSFLFLESSALLGKCYRFTVALVQDDFRVASN